MGTTSVWNLAIRPSIHRSNDFCLYFLRCLAWRASFYSPRRGGKSFSSQTGGYVGNSGNSVRMDRSFRVMELLFSIPYRLRRVAAMPPRLIWKGYFCSRDGCILRYKNSKNKGNSIFLLIFLSKSCNRYRKSACIGNSRRRGASAWFARSLGRDVELTLLSINLGRGSGKLCRCVKAGPGQTQRCMLMVVGESGEEIHGQSEPENRTSIQRLVTPWYANANKAVLTVGWMRRHN